MKGLILKDIYCIRMMLILGMFIMLFPNFMLVMMGGGMHVGLENSIVGAIPYALLGFCNIVCMSTFVLNSFTEDETTGWGKLQGIMPVTRGEIVRAKFITALISVGMMTAVTLLSSIFGIVIFGIPVEPMLTIPLCLALFEVCLLFATIAINFRYGAKFCAVVYYTFVTLGTAAMIGLLFIALKGDNIALMIRLMFYVVLPLITCAVTLAAYRSSVRAVAAEQ